MDLEITGAKILVSIPELGGFMLTESVVVTWGVMLVLILVSTLLLRSINPAERKGGRA